MEDLIVGRFRAFRNHGDGDEVADRNVIVEITDRIQGGRIEIAFDAPLPGTPRIYLEINLVELVRAVMGPLGTKDE